MADSCPSGSESHSGSSQHSSISHIQDFISREKGTPFFAKSLKRSFNFDDDGEISDPPENVVQEVFAIFPESPATIFIETKGKIPSSYGRNLAVILTEYVQPFLDEVICTIPVVIENDNMSQLADQRERVLEEFNRKCPLQLLLMTPAKSRNLLKAAQVAMTLGAFLARQREHSGKVDLNMEKSMMRRLRSFGDDILEEFVALGRVLYALEPPSPRLALYSRQNQTDEELGKWTNPTHLRCSAPDENKLKKLLEESNIQLLGSHHEGKSIVFADITTETERVAGVNGEESQLPPLTVVSCS